MAYDREKYEKQDKSANDVRNNLKIYVFMQIAELLLMSYIPQSFKCFIGWLSTHLLSSGTVYKLKALIRVTMLISTNK